VLLCPHEPKMNMKVRLNKTVMAQMDSRVGEIVSEWKARFGKAFISVEHRQYFYANEDARVTMINLATDAKASAQASGDFAGKTNLSPTAAIPLADGVVAIEQGFFCGVPYLTIYQHSPTQIPRTNRNPIWEAEGCSTPGCGYPDGNPCIKCGLVIPEAVALA
jgi:hypothetical protein